MPPPVTSSSTIDSRDSPTCRMATSRDSTLSPTTATIALGTYSNNPMYRAVLIGSVSYFTTTHDIKAGYSMNYAKRTGNVYSTSGMRARLPQRRSRCGQYLEHARQLRDAGSRAGSVHSGQVASDAQADAEHGSAVRNQLRVDAGDMSAADAVHRGAMFRRHRWRARLEGGQSAVLGGVRPAWATAPRR